MKILRFLMQESKIVVIFAVVIGLIAGISSTIVVSMIHRQLSNMDSLTTASVGLFAGLCLAVLISQAVSQILIVYLAQNAFSELRLYLSRKILSTPLYHLEKIGPSRLLATLSDDVLTIANSVNAVPLVFINATILIGCIIYLFWLSWPAFLTVVIFLAIGIFSYLVPVKWGDRYFNNAREDQDAIFLRFRALVEGIKELKLHSHRREDFLTSYLQPALQSYRDNHLSGMCIYLVAENWGQILFFVCIGVILFVLPHLLEVDASVVTGYVLVTLYMINPVRSVVGWLPPMGRASVALRKIESLGLLLSEAGVEDGTNVSLPEEACWKHLKLVETTYTYHSEQETDSFTLGPINVCISPGELVFLVGGNGSGKSTLAKVFTGLYPPETGRILLDGQPIENQNREWYRLHFSAVFADYYLFDRFLGLVGPDLEMRAASYLRQLELEHKVEVRDGALSTTNLSGGQRKRLALLTAYLEDRPIYVFDEWASDQDPVFKEVFYAQLLQDLKARNKAALVITHDDGYFHLADRIIRLDYGQVQYDRPVAFSQDAAQSDKLEFGLEKVDDQRMGLG
jgi:putative ATP-binding cassette transporter